MSENPHMDLWIIRGNMEVLFQFRERNNGADIRELTNSEKQGGLAKDLIQGVDSL